MRQTEGASIERKWVAQPFFFVFSPSLFSPSNSLTLCSLTSINLSFAKVYLLFLSYFLVLTQFVIFRPDFQVCMFVPFILFGTARELTFTISNPHQRVLHLLFSYILRANHSCKREIGRENVFCLQWCSWGQLVPLQGIGLLPLASHFSSIPY